jgi:hypothetical protein
MVRYIIGRRVYGRLPRYYRHQLPTRQIQATVPTFPVARMKRILHRCARVRHLAQPFTTVAYCHWRRPLRIIEREGQASCERSFQGDYNE